MTLTTGYFATGPTLTAHVEDGHWWTTCPGCPGFSAAADSWAELLRLVSDWHNGEAPHRGWVMLPALTVESKP